MSITKVPHRGGDYDEPSNRNKSVLSNQSGTKVSE